MAQQKVVAITNEKPRSLVDSPLKPTAELHLLIGGPYKQNGEEHRYGHTALRVKTSKIDNIYDFGRYGEITGTFGESGEGILRQWTDFDAYIRSENQLKRMTTGFVFLVFEPNADAVVTYFDHLIKVGKRRADLEKGRTSMKVYSLAAAYNAITNNCTTISMDGIKQAVPKLDEGSQKFINPEAVMTWAERTAMKTLEGVPTRIFLPANLLNFLTTAPGVKPNRIDAHGGKE